MKTNTTNPTMNANTALLSIGLALCGAMSAPAQTYTITKIPQPAGTSGYAADSVNNSGQVVGNTSVKSGRSNVPGRPFVWTNGVFVSLPPLGNDTAASANSINDSGLVIGHSPSESVYASLPRAVWWQNTGNVYVPGDWNAFLPSASSLHLFGAVAISADSRFVVFDALDNVTGHDQAAVAEIAFDGTGPSGFTGLWLIGSLDGSVSSEGFVSAALDISHNGNGVVRVAGYANTQSTAQAFLWEKDDMGAVQMFDLDPSTNTFSSAEGVNGWGAVAGNIQVSGIYQAHFWDMDGSRQSLGTLGGSRAYALSINDPGYVVGWSNRSGKNAVNHAFLWHPSTGMRDLNALKSPADTSGLELTTASKINNAGQILARGSSKSTGSVAVLLNPQ